jgi:hypothetical protein
MTIQSQEISGAWEDLVTRPEFRGHQVKITIIDQPSVVTESDEWLESLRRMASNGVHITRPADDSREGIYEGVE